MKVTIIPIDKTVYVNGVCKFRLDLSLCGIPSDVHALQWKDTSGWIEFCDTPEGIKPENEVIDILPAWATQCVEVWESK